MPFEKHRARLVRLIDDCISLIENDKDFVCFNLDGHTAPIEDYLESVRTCVKSLKSIFPKEK